MNTDSILALLGHKIPGERQKYTDIRVFPEIAAEACKAIEKFYFGTSSIGEPATETPPKKGNQTP